MGQNVFSPLNGINLHKKRTLLTTALCLREILLKIAAESIPSHDILCGGFPCQAFSISGKRLGFEDTRGTLFFDIARIVEYHKPKVVFMENVKNLAKHDNGNTFSVIANVMGELGFYLV